MTLSILFITINKNTNTHIHTMELSNTHTDAEPKLKQVNIQLDENTYNQLRLLQRQDGITPGIRLRNVIKQMVLNGRIETYRG